MRTTGSIMTFTNRFIVLVSVMLFGTHSAVSAPLLGACRPGGKNVFLPSTILVEPNNDVSVEVTLDTVACSGGAIVLLALNPGVSASVPPSVTVQEGQMSAEFLLVAGSEVGQEELTASINQSVARVTVFIMVLEEQIFKSGFEVNENL
jgi:hypothetical protein